MKQLKNDILEQWLKIEFTSVAHKMGLINADRVVRYDETLIYNSVRCLDYESIMADSPDVNYIVTIIGLMWEHIDFEEYDLRKIIVKFLSRIGYPTSAIICDEKFDRANCKFTVLDSYIDEITTTINQLNNEVNIGNRKYLLTNFQKEIWDSMDRDKILGISAPTSAGKSFVILLKIINRLRAENIDIVYIVPTLSLLNQVMEDFNRELKANDVENYWITNSFDKEQVKDRKNIYIMTQEKAIVAFDNFEEPFSKKLILVADEIQNIERIQEDSDQRSKILFDTLMEFRYKDNVEQIVISGPRIEEIDKVGKSIFGIETIEHTTKISPVLNLTYSIKKVEQQYFFKQYCMLTPTPLEIEIENSNFIKCYGKKKYTDDYLEYLSGVVNNIGADSQNIIFAPTSSTARKIAVALELPITQYNSDLIEYYRNSVSENYSLCDTLMKGVAYHHGKLPMHVRRTLEVAITNKEVSNVVCTTTLLQGVNLPAQNIFIRNPHLYINKTLDAAELTNYEMANLRGRAGRLLKDYVGRTFVMDEDSFLETNGYEKLELFDDESKELSTGYEQRFQEYKGEIEEALNHDKVVDETMRKYGYIISYIRQSILRYGRDAKHRMDNVGIKLTQKQVAAIILKLENLSIPKEVCYKNRYWDPFVLEKIYTDFDLIVPKTPSEKGAKNKLDKILKWLRDKEETAFMYKKYIPSLYQNGQSRSIMVSLGLHWANGIKLYDIFNNDRYKGDSGAEKIDETIELLQQTISFNLPLLLKPIYDIKNPDSCFLVCMQSGAINNITRAMIEIGIPRETALYLFGKIFVNFKDNEKSELSEENIREIIKQNYDALPYWIQGQLNFIK
ncbi:DEAD/DEAH box helicase [Mogibacterium timidum]